MNGPRLPSSCRLPSDVFGDIKRNWGFRRFLLRGLEKADHEMRMVAMGHNIRKLTYALAV